MVRVFSTYDTVDYMAAPLAGPPSVRADRGWSILWLSLGLALAATAWALQSWLILLLVAFILCVLLAHSYWADVILPARHRGREHGMLLRFLLDNMSMACVATDAQGKAVASNALYLDLDHCNADLSPFALVPPATLSDMQALLKRAQREGRAQLFLPAEGLCKNPMDIRVQRISALSDIFLWTVAKPIIVQDQGKAEEISDATQALEDIWALPAACVDKDGYIIGCSKAFSTLVDVPNPQGELLWHHVARDVSGDVYLLHKGESSAHSGYKGLAFAAPSHASEDHHLWIFHRTQDVVITPPTDVAASLLALLPLGLAFVDRDGRFIFMNEAFQAAACLRETSYLLYPSDMVVEDDKIIVADAIQRAVRSQDGGARDVRVRLKGRPEEPVILTITRTPEFGRAAVLLSLKDDREQQKLERQIAQATKMQAIGQLAGGVAHDFNNILTAVIGYCDLMLARHLPGDADFDDINQVRQNANRAANLVRQLLAFSRQQTLRPQFLNISDVIGDLSHMLKRLLGEHVVLHTVHGRNLAPVRADPGQLEQVIVNLAVNARDAMPEGGELVISTFSVAADKVRALGHSIMPTADYVAISVRDTGTGIEPNVMAKIFEPFFTTKEVGRGTGLGLSTVYGIVKQTGGYIFAESRADKGTCFTIYFPAQKQAMPDTRLVAPPAEPFAETWGHGTIVVVEDETMVRAVVERALMRKGYHVFAAGNGEEALALLQQRDAPVDLLISDVVMPIMDGPTLVRHARARWPDLPIIFMSGYAEEQLRASINMASVTFLPKPFSVQELGETVRNVLSAR